MQHRVREEAWDSYGAAMSTRTRPSTTQARPSNTQTRLRHPYLWSADSLHLACLTTLPSSRSRLKTPPFTRMGNSLAKNLLSSSVAATRSL